LTSNKSQVSYKQLSAFFIPLGFAASLTSVTHVIINVTLTRADDAAFIIACYAVALSLFQVVERPIIVFRQTSSALVKDKQSFKLLTFGRDDYRVSH
jgi:progressive ankylosis protein